MRNHQSVSKELKLLVKKCHVCGTIMESTREQQRCKSCDKSFLPSNYFGKVHAKNDKDYEKLFSTTDELQDEDLIKGLSVLW